MTSDRYIKVVPTLIMRNYDLFYIKKYTNNKQREIEIDLCTQMCVLETIKFFFNSVKTLIHRDQSLIYLLRETLKNKSSFYFSGLKLD